ncbi:MAG: helix-turn-helix transcriptional regulator [Bacillota bacterium]|nr:helix-turn-helix transcriptional regulator [Bacillota bacterium]MDW7678069.1 helix-turn-helix transcriptional regulator [Bacillota bacterium]
MILLFGEFITAKRKALDIKLREMAEELGISPAYLSDIEKSRRKPPDIDMLEKMAEILKLSPDDKSIMMDYAGQDRKEIAPDLPDYLMDLPEARTALRKARDKGKVGDFWNNILTKLDEEEE